MTSRSEVNLAGTHPAPMKSEGEGNADGGVVQGMSGGVVR